MIDRVLAFPEMDTDPWDDLGNWATDAYPYRGVQLSHSKMLNEVGNREPRIRSIGAVREQPSLCWNHTGMHSTSEWIR